MARHYGQVKGRSYPVPAVSRAEMPCAEPSRKHQEPAPEPVPDPDEAQRDYVLQRNKERDAESIRKRLLKMIDDPNDPRHGTATGHKYGCRCDRCVGARRKGNA